MKQRGIIMEKKPLIIIAGPTAVGKTDISIALAKAINGSIISADSMQVYRGMDIGSAKIKPYEMDGIAHYLIDILEPSEDFNIVLFQKYATQAIADIQKAGKIPILVGGTGFYIQSILYGIEFTTKETDQNYRRELQTILDEKGSSCLYEMLKTVDPKSTEIIHENNTKRVMRALEYYHETGECISEHNEEQHLRKSAYLDAYFVLNDERKHLYERIDARVEQMITDGLVEEVRKLKNRGLIATQVSMQGLGYKEIMAYLNGECTLDEAVYRIKRDTRHFAKRQLTWFRREENTIWINRNEFVNPKKEILPIMIKTLKERGIVK